tara:strand:+ start:2377 stop:2832 length:456 start_codon:yes stop_codon:yes gene_type:complete
MASTISPATLTVTHTEALTLNGVDRGVTNSLTIASVNEVDHRIMTIPTDALYTVAAMGAAVSSGTFVNSGVKYIRVTNKDDTNFVTLGLEASGDASYFKLKAGESFVLYSDDLDANNAVIAHGAISFGDITSVKAKADTATVDLEVFVAST